MRNYSYFQLGKIKIKTKNIRLTFFSVENRAGCLGINLIAANRVIVLDVSWNPCLDAQAVCRVYRYGQTKHCFIYRLIADYTMEKRIYDRQIAKQGMSDRVVDELQPETQFTRNEVENLIHFAIDEETAAPDLLEKIDEISNDYLLTTICQQFAQSITKLPFTHESLLLDKKEYQLTSAEKRRAQKEYQYVKQMNIHSNRSRLQTARSYDENLLFSLCLLHSFFFLLLVRHIFITIIIITTFLIIFVIILRTVTIRVQFHWIEN